MVDYAGTAGDDTYTGTGDADDIEGLGGNDVLRGGGGDDDIDGGLGNDEIHGDDGNDDLQGDQGDDHIYGGAGDDRITDSYSNYSYGSDNDILDGGAGNDVIVSYQQADFNDRDILNGGDGDDRLVVNGAQTNDQINGDGGIDTAVISVNAGSNSYGGPSFFAALNPTSFIVQQNGVNSVFVTGCEILEWYSGGGNDTITGGALDDQIVSTGGSDTFRGLGGDDELGIQSFGDVIGVLNFDGGDGVDVFSWFNDRRGSDVFVFDLPSGTFIRNGVSIGTVANFERINFTAFEEVVQADRIVGGAYVDSIALGGGDDTAFGGAGDDTLSGNIGADYLNGGAGNDELHGGVSGAITDGVIEKDRLVGGGGDDVIYIRPYIDSWSGPWGTSAAGSIYDGGSGNDRLMIYDARNIDFSQATITGIETLTSQLGYNSYTFSLSSAQVNAIRDFDVREKIRLTDDTGVVLKGVMKAEGFYLADGGQGFNYSAATNDTGATPRVYGGSGNDLITGGALTDWMHGGAGADRLIGGAGNDTLDGGEGNDILTGGAGDDTYRVDSVNDQVIEAAGGGTDTVYGVGSGAALGANVENLIISGGFDGVFLAVGNDLANTITGSGARAERIRGGGGDDILSGGAGQALDTVDYSDKTQSVVLTLNFAATIRALVGGVAEDSLRYFVHAIGGSADDTLTGDAFGNTLTGLAGNDRLNGGFGDDALVGGEGNDLLDGGAGVDRMNGGAGNDTYTVDNAGDRVIEVAGGGIDRVNTIVSFDARETHVENIAITGTARANVVGNALNNVITGNDESNAISGGAGADRMAGGKGSDVYTVDDVGDVVIEAANAGTDTVRAGVSFALGANVENLTLVTNRQINAIGNALDNVIIGNDRPNVIIGMGGRDLMTGGGGADRFDFRAVSDSPFAAYDRITDLEDQDVINLSAIDANTTLAGDQAFVLVSAFSGGAGQMTRTYNAAGDFTVLSMDVNGDRVGDMRIILDGDHRDYDTFRL